MKNRLPSLVAASTAAVITLAPAASGALVGRYAVDANTVQLWSFDESSGFTGVMSNDVVGGADVSPVNITGNGSATANSNLTGFASAPGFGNAVNIGQDLNDGIGNPVLTTASALGIDDAFTMEALINIDDLSATQEIISMESDGFSRPFQFVINGGNLRFHGITAGGIIEFAVPTTGPDAFVANNWFHVAVTYNGIENSADNLSLYWTALDESRTEANLLGSGTLTSDLSSGNAFFYIGNEGRQAGNENLQGLIDEVRLSDIARGADAMAFAIPEPSVLVLFSAAGVLGLLVLRRRR